MKGAFLKVRFDEKPCFTAAADYQYIFIAGMGGIFRAAVHHQPFGLRQKHVVFKNGVDIWGNIGGCSP